MERYLKFIEYIWLIVAAISFFEIFNLWSTDTTRASFFIISFVVAVAMFLLRRKQRIVREKRRQS